jgi:hypothetical protein
MRKRYLLVLFLTSPGICRDWLQTVTSPPQYVLSDDTVAWIQEELENDEAGNSQEIQSNFLPTRLLDIEVDPHAGSVRLVETMAMVSRPRYLTLSYCWGDQSEAAQQLKTTSSTLRQHLDCLPLDQTTSVVHGAIRVALALHVRHLWIDALCIIQDGIEDWARKSRLMGLIYTKAYATICALVSSSLIFLGLLLEVLLHQYYYHVSRPSKDLDAVFQVGCAAPDTKAPRKNAAIIMLTRNEDLYSAITSLQSLEDHFNRFFNYPVFFMNNEPFSADFKSCVSAVISGDAIF